MRIGIFVESYKSGGVNTVIVNQINHWPSNDEIILITNKNHVGLKKVISKKVRRPFEVVTIPFDTLTDLYLKLEKWIPKFIIRSMFYYGRYVYTLLAYFKLKKLFCSLNLDALFIHNGGYPGAQLARCACLASRQVGISAVFMIIHNLAKPIPLFQWPLEKYFDVILDRVVVMIGVSQAVKQSVRQFRFFKQELSVIYNGIDLNTVINDGEHNLHLPNDLVKSKNVILTLSTYEERKGHQYLLEALSYLRGNTQLPDFYYVIGGEGTAEETARLKKLVKQYQLEDCVIFAGFIKEITPYLLLSNLLVYPSVESESFGLSIIEAALHDVPVVASDIPGVNETLVHNHSALFVPARSAPHLAKAIFDILTDQELANMLVLNARKLVLEKYGAKKMCSEYYRLINSKAESSIQSELIA